tara:strand:+ start:431 stop:634 length:204 start_codon:yes stop_codon:yes gene_type:complete
MVVHDRTRLIGQLPFLSLFLNSLFIGSNGQALSVVGAHIRVESQEFIEVDGLMPLEYGAGINPFSPL